MPSTSTRISALTWIKRRHDQLGLVAQSIVFSLAAIICFHSCGNSSLVVFALPNQVLHTHWDLTQRAHHPLSTVVSSQGALCPCIDWQPSGHLVKLACMAFLIDAPVRPPHQGKGMLQLLNPAGPLIVPVSMLQLPLKIGPRELQVQLSRRQDASRCTDPIIETAGIPSHVHHVHLKCSHGPCDHHPRIGCSFEPSPAHSPCCVELRKLLRRPIEHKQMHGLELSFNHSSQWVLQLSHSGHTQRPHYLPSEDLHAWPAEYGGSGGAGAQCPELPIHNTLLSVQTSSTL